MQRFLIEKNVAAFVARFHNEPDPDTRDILRRLLIDEEDKFGYRSEKLEIVERYISDCNSRIAKLRDLKIDRDSRFPTPSVSAQTLENLMTLAALLEAHRDQLRRQLDDGGF